MFTGLSSPSHLLFILVVILLLFGAKRIPELARGLGVGMREFRRGVSGEDEQDEVQEDHERGEGELSSQRGDTHRRRREG